MGVSAAPLVSVNGSWSFGKEKYLVSGAIRCLLQASQVAANRRLEFRSALY